jgi:hypothetical protein
MQAIRMAAENMEEKMESRTYNFGVLLASLNNLRAEYTGLSNSDILNYDVLITHESGMIGTSLIPPEWDQFSHYDLEGRITHDQASMQETLQDEQVRADLGLGEDEYRSHGEAAAIEYTGDS